MKRTIFVVALSIAGFIAVWRFEPGPVGRAAAAPPPAAVAAPSSSAAAPPGTSPSTSDSANATVTTQGTPESGSYGTVQVQVTFTGSRLSVITLLQAPDGGRALTALPRLQEEAVQAQSADIDTVTGATETSESYKTSLQAAIDARGQPVTTRVEQVMGLPISLDLRNFADSAVVDDVFAWFRDVDARFSPFKEDSEVSRYDRGELTAAELSDDLLEVLELCAYYEQLSGGAFRARLPGRGLDPCAVVKGWAVQRAADVLRAEGATTFCLNAGGDVVTAGEPEPGRPWRVGVRHPEQPLAVCAVLESRDGAIATSAAYERGSHILDGRDGTPATGLMSVTIVAGDLVTADALATAAFAMGAEGITWAADRPGCEILVVDDGRRVHRTAGLALVS